MLLLSVPMSWICFRKAVLKPLCVGKARYSNKEKFGILEENLRPPPSSSESRSSPILAIEVAPNIINSEPKTNNYLFPETTDKTLDLEK